MQISDWLGVLQTNKTLDRFMSIALLLLVAPLGFSRRKAGLVGSQAV